MNRRDFKKRTLFIVRKTGFKNIELENSKKAIDFFSQVLSDFNEEELLKHFGPEFFTDLFKRIKDISKTAFAPISKAFYGSIFVFEKNDKYFVHAGANIDPGKKENFKIPKFRNCAEKQASLSGLEEDRLETKDLKIMFLFRLDNKIKELTAQKLLPCKDCHEKYLHDIKKNKGLMVIISEEMNSNDFLKSEANKLQELKFNNEFRYIFFKGNDLENLNLEAELGGSIRADNR